MITYKMTTIERGKKKRGRRRKMTANECMKLSRRRLLLLLVKKRKKKRTKKKIRKKKRKRFLFSLNLLFCLIHFHPSACHHQLCTHCDTQEKTEFNAVSVRERVAQCILVTQLTTTISLGSYLSSIHCVYCLLFHLFKNKKNDHQHHRKARTHSPLNYPFF